MTSAHPKPLDWALLLALTVLWGSAFLLTKVAVTALPPDLVVAGRLSLGALVLVPLAMLWRRGSGGPRPHWGARSWAFFLAIAVFGYVLPFSLIAWGQRGIASGLAGILMAVMPLGTLGLAHFLVPGERMTRYRAGGFLLGFAGVSVLLGPESLLGLLDGQGPWLHMLAVLAGAMSYAVSAILSRLRPPDATLPSAAATVSIAAALTLALVLGSADPGVRSPVGAHGGWSQWGAVAGLGVFSTACASVVYFKLVARAGPAFVAQLNYLIPPWAVLVGMLFLGERPQPRHLIGLALILGGILMAHLERRSARAKDQGPRAET
jgi:drug/metabolite transporter (DMT)-like permease